MYNKLYLLITLLLFACEDLGETISYTRQANDNLRSTSTSVNSQSLADVYPNPNYWDYSRSGVVGSVYVYYNPHNGDTEYFKLLKASGYGNYPITKKPSPTSSWEYLGTQPIPTYFDPDDQQSIRIYDQGSESGISSYGTIYAHLNTSLKVIEYYQRNGGSDKGPGGRKHSTGWRYLGEAREPRYYSPEYPKDFIEWKKDMTASKGEFYSVSASVGAQDFTLYYQSMKNTSEYPPMELDPEKPIAIVPPGNPNWRYLGQRSGLSRQFRMVANKYLAYLSSNFIPETPGKIPKMSGRPKPFNPDPDKVSISQTTPAKTFFKRILKNVYVNMSVTLGKEKLYLEFKSLNKSEKMMLGMILLDPATAEPYFNFLGHPHSSEMNHPFPSEILKDSLNHVYDTATSNKFFKPYWLELVQEITKSHGFQWSTEKDFASNIAEFTELAKLGSYGNPYDRIDALRIQADLKDLFLADKMEFVEQLSVLSAEEVGILFDLLRRTLPDPSILHHLGDSSGRSKRSLDLDQVAVQLAGILTKAVKGLHIGPFGIDPWNIAKGMSVAAARIITSKTIGATLSGDMAARAIYSMSLLTASLQSNSPKESAVLIGQVTLEIVIAMLNLSAEVPADLMEVKLEESSFATLGGKIVSASTLGDFIRQAVDELRAPIEGVRALKAIISEALDGSWAEEFANSNILARGSLKLISAGLESGMLREADLSPFAAPVPSRSQRSVEAIKSLVDGSDMLREAGLPTYATPIPSRSRRSVEAINPINKLNDYFPSSMGILGIFQVGAGVPVEGMTYKSGNWGVGLGNRYRIQVNLIPGRTEVLRGSTEAQLVMRVQIFLHSELSYGLDFQGSFWDAIKYSFGGETFNLRDSIGGVFVRNHGVDIPLIFKDGSWKIYDDAIDYLEEVVVRPFEAAYGLNVNNFLSQAQSLPGTPLDSNEGTKVSRFMTNLDSRLSLAQENGIHFRWHWENRKTSQAMFLNLSTIVLSHMFAAGIAAVSAPSGIGLGLFKGGVVGELASSTLQTFLLGAESMGNNLQPDEINGWLGLTVGADNFFSAGKGSLDGGSGGDELRRKRSPAEDVFTRYSTEEMAKKLSSSLNVDTFVGLLRIWVSYGYSIKGEKNDVERFDID